MSEQASSKAAVSKEHQTYLELEDMVNSMMGEVFTILDAAYGSEVGEDYMMSSTITPMRGRSKSGAIKDLIKQTMWRRLGDYAKRNLGAVTLD